MDKEALNTNLNYFINNSNDMGITVYAVVKDQENPKKLDIRQEDSSNLKSILLEFLKNEIIDNNALSIMKLSSSDNRKNTLYEYDLEVPAELSSLDSVNTSDGHSMFNFSEDKLENIIALLIEIGNNEQQIVLYKTMARVNIYGRSSFFLKKSNHRFEQIDDDFFRISPNFQLIQVAGSLIVVDLNTIEKFFGFHDIIKREAQAGISAIENMSLLENPEVLHELVEDISFARKLTKIAKSSPVIKAKVPNSRIIAFCKTCPELKDKIRFNDGETKIMLDTKKSKDLFVKMLMDDFLVSELTNYHYTSLAKDEAKEDISKPSIPIEFENTEFILKKHWAINTQRNEVEPFEG